MNCFGKTLPSRIASSPLHGIGLPDLVTTSLVASEALDLARHPKALSALRLRLAANGQVSVGR